MFVCDEQFQLKVASGSHLEIHQYEKHYINTQETLGPCKCIWIKAAGWPSETPLTLLSFPGELCLYWNLLQLCLCCSLSLSAALGGRCAPLPQDVQTHHWHRTGCAGWKSRHWIPLWVRTGFPAFLFSLFNLYCWLLADPLWAVQGSGKDFVKGVVIK